MSCFGINIRFKRTLMMVNNTVLFIYFRGYLFNGQNFDFKIRRDNQKISYERLVYELVDDNSLSLAIYQKPTKKKRMEQLRVKRKFRKYKIIITKVDSSSRTCFQNL